MAAEPPFYTGLLHMLSLFQILLRMSSCFHQWWKDTFSAIVKNIGEKQTFQKGDFWFLDTFSPKVKEEASNLVRTLKRWLFWAENVAFELKKKSPFQRPYFL